MNIRILGLAVATAAAFTSSISNASEKAAANACARAFAASMVPEGIPAPAYKLDYRSSGYPASIADQFPVNSIFELEAHDPKSGAVIARARWYGSGSLEWCRPRG